MLRGPDVESRVREREKERERGRGGGAKRERVTHDVYEHGWCWCRAVMARSRGPLHLERFAEFMACGATRPLKRVGSVRRVGVGRQSVRDLSRPVLGNHF